MTDDKGPEGKEEDEGTVKERREETENDEEATEGATIGKKEQKKTEGGKG